MRLFSCPVGGPGLWFHNLAAADGAPVGYDPERRAFVASPTVCANRGLIDCNWTAAAPGALCRACAMTALAPDPSVADAQSNWAETEAAKRWVLDNLGRWGWFRPEDPGPAPVFHMLAEGRVPVQMGHMNGVVTISVAEADHVLRTARREALSEPYRTMIGHMRHEISHALWWRLSLHDGFLDAFRETFGDERIDYQDALQAYYRDGPPAGWRDAHLTAYASAHPHEDWAETAAHLLHLTDLADSFVSAGLASPDLPEPGWSVYAESDPFQLINAAAALAVGINHVNRSMGLADVYPFVLSDRARSKLAFAHRWLRTGPRSA